MEFNFNEVHGNALSFNETVDLHVPSENFTSGKEADDMVHNMIADRLDKVQQKLWNTIEEEMCKISYKAYKSAVDDGTFSNERFGLGLEYFKKNLDRIISCDTKYLDIITILWARPQSKTQLNYTGNDQLFTINVNIYSEVILTKLTDEIYKSIVVGCQKHKVDAIILVNRSLLLEAIVYFNDVVNKFASFS